MQLLVGLIMYLSLHASSQQLASTILKHTRAGSSLLQDFKLLFIGKTFLSFLAFLLFSCALSLGFLASQGGLYIVSKLNDLATMRVSLKGFALNKIWKGFYSVAVDHSCPAVDRPVVSGRPVRHGWSTIS